MAKQKIKRKAVSVYLEGTGDGKRLEELNKHFESGYEVESITSNSFDGYCIILLILKSDA